MTNIKKEEVEVASSSVEKRFSKKALLESNIYNPDIINAFLENDKEYTKSEVDKVIKDYMKKGEVK